jgi:RND superfamily putative drug exporter
VFKTIALGGDLMQRTPVDSSRNIAARMGRWSASHRKTAIFGWLAFVIGALVIGVAVGQKTIDEKEANVGQAHKADQILKHAGFAQSERLTEIVLVQSKTQTVADAGFRRTVGDVASAVAPFKTVHHLRWSLSPKSGQVSRDEHTALVEWDMTGKLKTAEGQIDPLTRTVESVARAHPGFYVGEAGAVSSSKALNKLFNEQLGQAGVRSLPLTLLILLLVFGSLLAAWIPLMLGLQAVIATVGLTAIVSHVVPMNQSVASVVLLVGLAVGVDYTLFYLRREREERAAGRSERAALQAAAATSGRSVLISGATVIIAMAGMLFSRDATFVSFSIATMMVVAVAMLGSLTVLPAVLSKLGDRVEKGRIPLLSRFRRPSGEGRIWSQILTPVLRHPAISVVASAALLLALATPALRLHTARAGVESLPRNAGTVETLDRVQAAFPGQATPAVVAVKTDTSAPAFASALTGLRHAAASSGQHYGNMTADSNPSHTVARVTIPLPGNGEDGTSMRALATLRNQLLPQTIGTVPGASYAVTGPTAASHDWNESMKSAMPLVFAFVLTFAFFLLLSSFRSIVIAAKAVVLNLLSVFAAYGVVVAVFQDGLGEHLLNFQSNSAIAPWLPLFMFVILFGLSMDYHVFILSRIREAHDRGMSTEDAVAHGIKTTAGTVTSAAIVMVGAFSVFATLPILEMKEMGIGLAVAVLLDATIVRGVLLPASMKLLGRWNWYLPNWLGWLPKLSTDVEPLAQPLTTAA